MDLEVDAPATCMSRESWKLCECDREGKEARHLGLQQHRIIFHTAGCWESKVKVFPSLLSPVATHCP